MATSVAERAWCVVVPHRPAGAAEARSRLSAELSSTVDADLVADAVAIVAELVGNAIRHATPLPGDVVRVAWRVRYQADAEIVEVRVTDGGAITEPRVRVLELESLDGRGLVIVGALARTWGFERDGLGQSVWAELATSRQPVSV